MAAGLFLLVAPGPGVLVLIIGAGFIAQQSLFAARVLDWAELQLRKLGIWSLRLWRRAPVAAKTLLVVVAIVLAGASTFAAYMFLFWR